ncbi:Beta carbonic anhydrase 5, chloroplastic [Ananas comosus]|uniref:carbonic anhydrase n=1 Tax=Ananas comosus TaxID=4615 RepID=A0A199V784_ANACO|nr:Beta carbonic anhydrase 5, chloroplastic [Ananas comosus]
MSLSPSPPLLLPRPRSQMYGSETLDPKSDSDPKLTRALHGSLLRSPLPVASPHRSTSDHEAFAGFRELCESLRKRVYVTELQKSFWLEQEIIDRNLVNYQNLAQQQAPKFMVVACADSRVCPTSILGFNLEKHLQFECSKLVPPMGLRTNAALEFAVNSLEQSLWGIQALMSMKENAESRASSEIGFQLGRVQLSTKAAQGVRALNAMQHCEKESINGSLLNLLTYPVTREPRAAWGYYDLSLQLEKWTLVYRKGLEGSSPLLSNSVSLME